MHLHLALAALLVLSIALASVLASSKDPNRLETSRQHEFFAIESVARRRLEKDKMSIDEEDYYMVDPPPRPRTPVKSGPIKYVDPALERPRIPHRRSRRNRPGYTGNNQVSFTPPPSCPPVVCKSWPSSSSEP